MVVRAIEIGLNTICFTDHMDYNFPKEYALPFVFDVKEYLQSIDAMKEKYSSKIKILTGIELGLKPGVEEQCQQLLANHSFDFVIGSSHLIDDMDPYYPNFWEKYSESQGLETYFKSIINNTKYFPDFDVYGHLDYIVRYLPSKVNRLSYSSYRQIIDEVLLTLIHHGKGIEVNTAGYKYGLSHAHPQEEILSRYYELGGRILTIGSDGHKPEHLAYDFDLAREMLLSLGIKQYTIFEKRKPVMVEL